MELEDTADSDRSLGLEATLVASLQTSLAKKFLAHVRQDDCGSFVIHDLEEHLLAVADLAGEFASTFGHADWGRLAGLWHDLEKYSSAFRSHIARGNNRVALMQRVGE